MHSKAVVRGAVEQKKGAGVDPGLLNMVGWSWSCAAAG